MIAANHLDLDRHFRIEIPDHFLARLEQFEFQTSSQTGLIDIGQQTVHLRFIRQLLEQRTESPLDLHHLFLISFKVDGLTLLVEEYVAQLTFLGTCLFEVIRGRTPDEPVAGGEQQDEQAQQQHTLDR